MLQEMRLAAPGIANYVDWVASWNIVRADDKPLARINLIHDLLTRLEFKGKNRQADLPNPEIVFGFHVDAVGNGLLAK